MTLAHAIYEPEAEVPAVGDAFGVAAQPFFFFAEKHHDDLKLDLEPEHRLFASFDKEDDALKMLSGRAMAKASMILDGTQLDAMIKAETLSQQFDDSVRVPGSGLPLSARTKIGAVAYELMAHGIDPAMVLRKNADRKPGASASAASPALRLPAPRF